MTPNDIVVQPEPAMVMFMSSMQSLVTSRSFTRFSTSPSSIYIQRLFPVTPISLRWTVRHWITTMDLINPELPLNAILGAGSDMLGGPVGHVPGTRSHRCNWSPHPDHLPSASFTGNSMQLLMSFRHHGLPWGSPTMCAELPGHHASPDHPIPALSCGRVVANQTDVASHQGCSGDYVSVLERLRGW